MTVTDGSTLESIVAFVSEGVGCDDDDDDDAAVVVDDDDDDESIQWFQ